MSKMDSASETLPRFVARLFEMPALRSLSALQKEEQALQFLRANGRQLQPLLSSMGLSSAAGWHETADTLAREMRTYADRLLEAEVTRAVDRRIGFTFHPALAGGREMPARARDELTAMSRRILNHPVARRALSGSLSAVLSDLTDKYIPPACESRKYIHVEVTRVQRLGLKAEECADLLRLLLFLRPAAYLQVTPGSELGRDSGFTPALVVDRGADTPDIAVILIALVHTFLEDYSILAGWTVAARRWIIWAGLGIDVFFTIEFFSRLYLALAQREGAEYFFRQRGWIDFIASIPLLVFKSLPGVLALLAGAGVVTGLTANLLGSIGVLPGLGMEEGGYNLEVKIPKRSADDDVFELARLYNNVFLPLKDREAGGGEQAPALAMEDVRSLVEKG